MLREKDLTAGIRRAYKKGSVKPVSVGRFMTFPISVQPEPIIRGTTAAAIPKRRL